MSEGQRIGELLLAAGLVTQAQLSQALYEQEARAGRLGEILVNLGFVTEVDLTQILSNQLSVAWVSLHHVDFTPELLSLVPGALALELRLVPVYFRLTRERKKILYVAMDDPTNVDAMKRVSQATGMNVRPLIAPPSELLAAIKEQYGLQSMSKTIPRRP
jgi:type IV pilus assembly protein PilB